MQTKMSILDMASSGEGSVREPASIQSEDFNQTQKGVTGPVKRYNSTPAFFRMFATSVFVCPDCAALSDS